jgi:hypothetical protein
VTNMQPVTHVYDPDSDQCAACRSCLWPGQWPMCSLSQSEMLRMTESVHDHHGIMTKDAHNIRFGDETQIHEADEMWCDCMTWHMKWKIAYIIPCVLGIRTNDSNATNRKFITADRSKHCMRVKLRCERSEDIAPSWTKEDLQCTDERAYECDRANVGCRREQGQNTCMSRIATLTGTWIRIPEIRQKTRKNHCSKVVDATARCFSGQNNQSNVHYLCKPVF